MIHVPKDVSVIGCDNIFYSGIRKISLTTIDHFVALKGRDAVSYTHLDVYKRQRMDRRTDPTDSLLFSCDEEI